MLRLQVVSSSGIAEQTTLTSMHGKCLLQGGKRDIFDHPIPTLIRDYSQLVELFFFPEDRKKCD